MYTYQEAYQSYTSLSSETEQWTTKKRTKTEKEKIRERMKRINTQWDFTIDDSLCVEKEYAFMPFVYLLQHCKHIYYETKK